MKATPEKDLLVSCRQILDLLTARGKLDYFRMHSIGIPNGRGGFRQNVDMLGFSDLLIMIESEPVLFVELKSKIGILSRSQLIFKACIERIGYQYHIVRSTNDLIKILYENGVRSWTFPIQK